MKNFCLLILMLLLPIMASGRSEATRIGTIYYYLNDTYAEVSDYTGYGGGEHGSYGGSVTIPSSVVWNGKTYPVTKIQTSAFYDCENLTSVTIPNSVTYIGPNAFQFCERLSSINIPSSVSFISQSTFKGCSGLTSVTIPNSVTSIGDYAFEDCSGLTSVTIPNSVTSIKGYAFSGCSGLRSVTIPNSVTSIGSSAFRGCSGLTSIEVESGNTKYDSRNNCNAIIESATNTLICGCKNTTIPNSVTSIGSSAFYGCSGLTSVTIPNSVISIGDHAFYRCSGLTSATIPDGVTSISDYAFYNCSGLASVTIPNSVTSIGSSAFYGCSSLAKIKTENTTPPSIQSNTISNYGKLYVLKGSKSSYASANYWGNFTIKEYPNSDVNEDNIIDVVDVVDIARYVVGTPRSIFEEFLADLNSDRIVNVADAIVLVNEIAGDTQFAKPAFAPRKAVNDALTLNGNGYSLSLQIEGTGEYAAFQFDLRLPTSMDMMQVSLNEARRQGHQLLYNKLGEGHYRVIALSTSGNVFNGKSGELLSMTLDDFTTDDVRIDNIHFVTARGIDVPFEAIGVNYVNDGVTTDIHSVDSNNTIKPIYKMNGQRLAAPRKGLNIIGGKKIVVK